MHCARKENALLHLGHFSGCIFRLFGRSFCIAKRGVQRSCGALLATVSLLYVSVAGKDMVGAVDWNGSNPDHLFGNLAFVPQKMVSEVEMTKFIVCEPERIFNDEMLS